MRQRRQTPRSPNLFPVTVEQFLTELDRRFPEPRPSPTDNPRETDWKLAQRSVYLQMQDAFDAAQRKDTPGVFD
ncbi:hypothetical protein [Caulobacter vibrioides]|uniref:Uncharacterized protein n=1 Tax=Caulobacter phage S2B TaxID=2759120 RepID=A0AAE7SXI1_9CAUD|nr:hypothetical protein [Caulobacter vibrioides]QOC54145.1 hypothetical protein [Caulobacter phage S2B]QXZ50181.1 hypothetical protein KZH45_09620 [Caulobacter vibrioides]